MLADLAHGDLAAADHCCLTTVGRESGRGQSVELWFAVHRDPGADRDTVYLLSRRGGRADWVRNLARTPEVEVSIGRSNWAGRARVVTDPAEDARARRLVMCKYRDRLPERAFHSGAVLPVAVDL
jgi:deazaflavin-dependent oxidoreductase (nitroreductase family)